MPELPEVEVCRRGLQPEVTGELILGAVVRSPRLRLPLPATLGDTLAGQRVVAVRRRGKYLLLDCRGGVEDGCLIIHLGMSGSLRFVANDKTPEKHDHVDILFARQTLRLSDQIPNQDERLKHILTKQIFEMSHNEILHEITIEAVSGGVPERRRWIEESGHYRIGNLAKMTPEEREQIVDDMLTEKD